jgi:hypothetical protein
VYIPKYTNIEHKKVGGCLDLIFGFSGNFDIAEIDFDENASEYLGEYETICETVLARLIKGLGGKKPEAEKPHDTVPLSTENNSSVSFLSRAMINPLQIAK